MVGLRKGLSWCGNGGGVNMAVVLDRVVVGVVVVWGGQSHNYRQIQWRICERIAMIAIVMRNAIGLLLMRRRILLE